jgi:hypothetical protein
MMKSYEPSELDRFAVIESLELSKLLRITINKIRKFMYEPRSLETTDSFPWRGGDRLARGGHSAVDVGSSSW